MKITQEILDSLSFTKHETADGYIEYRYNDKYLFTVNPKLSSIPFYYKFDEKTVDYYYTPLNTVSDLVEFLEENAQFQIEKCNYFQNLANEASNNVIALNVKITQLRAIEAGINPSEFNSAQNL